MVIQYLVGVNKKNVYMLYFIKTLGIQESRSQNSESRIIFPVVTTKSPDKLSSKNNIHDAGVSITGGRTNSDREGKKG